jgi:Clostripain family
MPNKMSGLTNFNNLILNFVVPGDRDQDNLSGDVWLKDMYDEIESEYLNSKNLKDCDIYIFSFRPENWNNESPLYFYVRKLQDNAFTDVTNFVYPNFFKPKNIQAIIDYILGAKFFSYTNRLLVIYGHSTGYYFFGNQMSDTSQFRESNLKRVSALGRIINPLALGFKNVINKFLTLDKKQKNNFRKIAKNEIPSITPNTLAEGIRKSRIGSFDLIVMANCNMQNMDVVSTLSPYARYIVSSQTFLSVKAFNFSTFISNSKRIDFSFCKDIIKKSNIQGDILNVGISALDLSELDSIVEQLNLINKYIIEHINELIDDLIVARKGVPYISGQEDVYSIDLLRWYQSLLKLIYKKIPPNVIANFQKLVDLIKENVYINDAFNENHQYGLLIYFPLSRDEYTNQDGKNSNIIYGSDVYTNSSFSKKSNWKVFLDLFFKKYRKVEETEEPV